MMILACAALWIVQTQTNVAVMDCVWALGILTYGEKAAPIGLGTAQNASSYVRKELVGWFTFYLWTIANMAWHVKDFIFKERTQRICPMNTPALHHVRMEAIVVGMGLLVSHVVMMEKVYFYWTGILCLPNRPIQPLRIQPLRVQHFWPQNLQAQPAPHPISLPLVPLPRLRHLQTKAPQGKRQK